jgi:GntR family transcriptional regulator
LALHIFSTSIGDPWVRIPLRRPLMNGSTDLLVQKSDIDDANPAPIYQQLASVIRDKIASHELVEGSKLPTETALSKGLGIGVSTVRSAYSLLVDEGLVTRRAGRGSFVSTPVLNRKLASLYNFTSEIRELGKTPISRVVKFEVGNPSAEVARELDISTTSPVFHIQRIRCADSDSLVLENVTLPVNRCPELTADDLKGSLYEALVRRGYAAPTTAHEIHEAIVLSKHDAKLLGRHPGDGAFRVTRTAYDLLKTPVEYAVNIAPGDKTRYVMDLGVDGTSVSKAHQL